MLHFWRYPRNGVFLLVAAAMAPILVWYGMLPVVFGVICLALGFYYGRRTCNDADLSGHD